MGHFCFVGGVTVSTVSGQCSTRPHGIGASNIRKHVKKRLFELFKLSVLGHMAGIWNRLGLSGPPHGFFGGLYWRICLEDFVGGFCWRILLEDFIGEFYW